MSKSKGKGGWHEKKGSKWGRLYIHHLKANHRNLKKCFECRGPSSEQEGTALFYLEFGSLARPGEAGVAFSGGMQRNSSYLASFLSASNRNSTQQRLRWTTEDTMKHSEPSSLSRDRQGSWRHRQKVMVDFFSNFFFFPLDWNYPF